MIFSQLIGIVSMSRGRINAFLISSRSGKLRTDMYNNIVNPPVVSQSEVDTNAKTLPWEYYPPEIPQNNFVISSDDVVKTPQLQNNNNSRSTMKPEPQTEKLSNQQPNDLDSEPEYASDDSNGQKYLHGNSVVSSSLDPSRMVASSLTNEPLEIRIAKLLTGTSLSTEAKPKPVNDNNDISSSTEPFHYEEAYTQPNNNNYSSTSHHPNNIKSESRRYSDDKPNSEAVHYKNEDGRQHNRSRHSSKSSTSYGAGQRVLILKTPPKKMTNREIEEILEKLKNQFIDDLKETLHRDICKKMIETTAYGSFHNWWDFKEHEHKVSSVVLGCLLLRLWCIDWCLEVVSFITMDI